MPEIVYVPPSYPGFPHGYAERESALGFAKADPRPEPVFPDAERIQRAIEFLEAQKKEKK